MIQPFRILLTLLHIETGVMNRLLFFFVCIVLFPFYLKAQSAEDVIYLKNGSILRGNILDTVTGINVRIEIIGHNQLLIPDSAIQLILKNQQKMAVGNETLSSPVEVAANVSFYGGSKNSGGFTFVTSYLFPFRLSAGVGLGIEWFNYQQLPFSAELAYNFCEGPCVPYLYAKAGYALPLSKKEKEYDPDNYGGVLAGAGAGLRFNFTKRNALIFSLGYRYQKTKTITGTYPWYSSGQQDETITYNEINRITFSFGFLFN
jgi:hypothetical protein